MVHESMENLKYDKRLARRRGWLDAREREQALEALPDVAPKSELVGVEEEARGGDGSPPDPAAS